MKNNLKKHLNQLPEYKADEALWDDIFAEIQNRKLKSALNDLPEYTAPDIFEKINKKNSFKWNIAASVAIILLSVSTIYYIQTKQNYATESANFFKYVPNTNNDYKALLAVCEYQTVTCQNPEFTELKEDFEHLQTAQNELIKQIGKYDSDKNLILQLDFIEKQKAEVLNKMATLI